jgi:hypothetical protein
MNRWCNTIHAEAVPVTGILFSDSNTWRLGNISPLKLIRMNHGNP